MFPEQGNPDLSSTNPMGIGSVLQRLQSVKVAVKQLADPLVIVQTKMVVLKERRGEVDKGVVKGHRRKDVFWRLQEGGGGGQRREVNVHHRQR